MTCKFCDIVAGGDDDVVVHATPSTVAFLDIRPVFPGHCLVVPRDHVVTLDELPADTMVPLLSSVQAIMRALERAVGAQGTFVAVNNIVSQSVAHLHVHVVPRRRKDGLRGFFWPRHPYASDDERRATAALIRQAVGELTGAPGTPPSSDGAVDM